MSVRLSLLILAAICWGYEEGFTQQRLIRGKVVENNSQAPLYPASISVGKRGAGSVTNSHGTFELYIPAAYSGDTLLVSFIGYKSQLVPLQHLPANKELVITLEKNATALKEVAIEARSPLKIIRKAIDRIPLNYLDQPHITKGFYRLTSRKDHEYMQLSEAVFDVYNYGYASAKENLLRLEKVRVANDRKAAHGVDLGLKPRLIFEYDVVKDIGNFNLLNKSGLQDHSFQIQGITSYNGHEAYEISFDQREGIKKSLYKGRLYIDTATLAFIAFDYALSPKGAAYARYGSSGTQALLKLLGLHIDLREDAAQIRYRNIGNKWIIADVTASSLLNFKNKREHYEFPADVNVSYVITAIDTAAVAPFAKEERLGSNKLIEFQAASAEPDFWKNYTIILPDFDAEAVIRKINTANEQSD